MRKVLINLDRSTERLETFYRVNKHVKDVERFSAVDGKGLRSSLKESGLLLEDADALYTDGALGCALSHAEQWRRVISSGGVERLSKMMLFFVRILKRNIRGF